MARGPLNGWWGGAGRGHDLITISAQTARFITKCSRQLFTILMPCCWAQNASRSTSTYFPGVAGQVWRGFTSLDRQSRPSQTCMVLHPVGLVQHTQPSAESLVLQTYPFPLTCPLYTGSTAEPKHVIYLPEPLHCPIDPPFLSHCEHNPHVYQLLANKRANLQCSCK